MLDFDSKNIAGMDDDAGDDQEPAPTRHWKATPTHDVYMVYAPKRNDEDEREDATKVRSSEKQSKRRRKRHSKPRLD